MKSRALPFYLLSVLLCVVFPFCYAQSQREKTLTIGVFSGSAWDVPQGDAYAVIDSVIERFEAAHPGVHVRYESGIPQNDYAEWLAEKMLAGDAPDVFLVTDSDFELYARLGALQDLAPLTAKDPAFDQKNYYPVLLAQGTKDEKLLALPVEAVPTLLFVNRTLLRNSGLTLPEDSLSWQEFAALAAKVTRDTDGDGTPDQFGVSGFSWEYAALTNGAQLFSPDGQSAYFTGTKMGEAVQLLRKLRLESGGRDVTARDFDLGRVAFRPMSFAEYRTYQPYPWRIKKYSTFDWDCVKLPHGPEGPAAYPTGVLLAAMNSKTRHEKLAWELLKLLCYDEATQALVLEKSQALPTRRDVLLSPEIARLLAGDGQTASGATGSQNAAPSSPSAASVISRETLDEVLSRAICPPLFPRAAAALRLADATMEQIIRADGAYENELVRLQKEMNAYLKSES